jgi:ribosome-binding protein aMBF1 (putative translation factor)
MQVKRCPFCGWEIKDEGKQVKVQDKTVLVCCHECAEAVKKDPAMHSAAR